MDQIIKNVKESKYYNVLPDETTDLSTKEQMAIHLRYITSNNIVEERFIGFIEITDATGRTLADVIWNFVVKIGFDPLVLRGQGYGGASNISGYIWTVAARILDKNPLALYTHCSNHVLNLVIVKSCSIAEIRNMFGTVQNVAVFFSDSPNKWHFFKMLLKRVHQIAIGQNWDNTARQDG